MEKIDEIYSTLNDLGLDEEEILSVKKRNKFLNIATKEDINEIIDFFKIKCDMDKEEMALLVIENPLILNETLERFNTLLEIYEKIGFSKKEYKEYIKKFNRAFSLNPREVNENIFELTKKGKNLEEIKSIIINKSYDMFNN